MWGSNSYSQRYQSNNKLAFDNGKNNLFHNLPNNTSNITDFNLLYQTPKKQFENVSNNNINNTNMTPFRFDFNHYFGNLWSSGKIPNSQLLQQQMILSPSQLNKDMNFYKKSIEKSYRLTPISQIKDSNSRNNSASNSNNNIVILNSSNKVNEQYEINNCDYNKNINTSNVIISDNEKENLNPSVNESTKKNLNELFNNIKNDKFLYDENKKKMTSPNNNNNIISNNNTTNNNQYRGFGNHRNRNYNLQISRQVIFSSPCISNKPKKIFECSGSSTLPTNSSNRGYNKNRRFRKNNEQIALLKKFYNDHKHWSKNQIKEISQKIGLKENKVYKWLWDQRNKEIKATKFVVKKGSNNQNNNSSINDE